MSEGISKGKSPFYPGQPVPVELFVGRKAQIDRIIQRGVGQVAAGKPIAMFVQGEYGVGKSSIANYVQRIAEKQYGLFPIYASLGGAHSVTDIATIVLESTLRAEAYETTRNERVRQWLARYIGKQTFFGIQVNLEALQQDAPSLSTPLGMLEFLAQLVSKLKETGIKGVFLVLDEINGVTPDPQFAQFIKGLVDTNALSSHPIPLLLMVCGVEARRREMVLKHQPIDRIFDLVEIENMSKPEMVEFFTQAFESVQVKVEPKGMEILTHYSGGFPKIMHVVGDAAFWQNQDFAINADDAFHAVTLAAEEVGKKFVDQQVYAALRSSDYRSILSKIAQVSGERFTRAEIAANLTETEKKKLDNFLRRMTSLNVIRRGEGAGEYLFNVRMVQLYILLQSSKTDPSAPETV